MKKIHITTLGCSKNTVDSEVLMGQLEANQFVIVDEAEKADVLVLNTCGFIQDAKEESIQAIFEALKLKEEDPAKKVFVAGCLSQRYRREIEKEIPEVDAIFGTEEYGAILDALGKQHAAVDNLHRIRRISTPRHYAYLKISEGCNHSCAFCAIPSIRGRHRSRSLSGLLEEAKRLVANGAREINCISQDTSFYGRDFQKNSAIPQLAGELAKIENLDWIRFLYWYPTNFPKAVLDLMQDGRILPYIDMPIQHISARVLKAMRRADTRDSLVRMFDEIRQRVPDITLRTTLILGHPGEREADFRELLDFIQHIKFDRVGTFVYSDEENTFAYDLPDKVPHEVALERQKELMELQQKISLQKNTDKIGSYQEVLIDSLDETGGVYSARTRADAPEIDNEVHIPNSTKSGEERVGSFAKVEITDASEYDLYGRFI